MPPHTRYFVVSKSMGGYIFGFLFSIKNLKLLGCVLLKEKCLNLENYLKHDNYWILMT